jgi:hypothetical protein
MNYFKSKAADPAVAAKEKAPTKAAAAKAAKAAKEEAAAESNEEKLNKLFDSFADDDDTESISMEGIAKMCEELDLDPSTDVKVLVLAHKLHASKPGQIARVEFIAGMTSLRVCTMLELKRKIPSFDVGFMEKTEFREFYRFCFSFSREGTHKTIEKELAMALMQMVLDTGRAPHLTYFLDFLNQSSQHARITMDQWDSFLQFNHTVALDISNIVDDGACKLLCEYYQFSQVLLMLSLFVV